MKFFKQFWLFIVAIFAVLGYVFTMGKRRGKQEERRDDAEEILDAAKEEHEKIDAMPDDDAAAALTESIGDKLNRLDQRAKRRNRKN